MLTKNSTRAILFVGGMSMETFGEVVRRLRKEKKITQRDLGKRVGVDFTYISKMESGSLRNQPSEKTIISVAEQLGADPEGLIILAKKIPTSMKETIEADDLATAFLRTVPKFNEEQREKIKRVIDEAKNHES